jgi:geranylgeranyl diphosphate synthase type I
MVAFSPTTDQLVGAIDQEIERWLDDRLTKLAHSDVLIEEMRRLIRAGGKRLRPSFCYWGYRAAGGESEETIVRAAASLELLHTFAIVHDDIMDASDERRGEPTVHVHRGTSVALLVGDLALVFADDMFMTSGFTPEVLAAAFRPYSRMRQQVIAGQYLDVVAASDPLTTEEHARLVARMKSGRYSVQEPLAIGATLGGASPDLIEELARFGSPLGEAFQLRDDLLGMFGERASTGKPVDSDVREGKHHLLYARTVASLEGPDRDFFLAHWGGGSDLTSGTVERLTDLVETSGARAYTEGLLESLCADADGQLEKLAVPLEVHTALRELAHLATGRSD